MEFTNNNIHSLFPLKKEQDLAVLSFGGGQDSTTILYKLCYEQDFRQKYAPGDLIVVMADTKNEHEETYEHVTQMQALCAVHDIPFFFIENHASGDWKDGLISYYEKTNTVGSKGFMKTCTDRLKIKPIYNWLDSYIHSTYLTPVSQNKKAIRYFARKNGKIKMLIGIARGEESRIADPSKIKQKWMKESIERVYPLVDLGMDRKDCHSYMNEIGVTIPMPSNCILCPFMSKQELLYLYKTRPHWFHKWCDLETNKLKKFAYQGDLSKTQKRNGDIVDNIGVWGNKKRLPEILHEAQQEFGHLSLEMLHEYKMSHGHCIKSKY